MPNLHSLPGSALLLLPLLLPTVAHSADDAESLTTQIKQLVRQLDDADGARRDEAEAAIVKLAPADAAEAEAFLARLPKATPRMPQEVQTRLARIRQRISRQTAERAVAATQLTLSGSDMELAAVLGAIHEQTGNRLMDYREQFGEPAEPIKVNIDAEAQSFWPAVDELLDQAGLAPYNYSGEDQLALINRPPGSSARVGRAAYAGPFRVEVSRLTAQRSLTQPNQNRLALELSISWEPRLLPIAISQPGSQIKVVGDNGQPISLVRPEGVFGVEIPTGSYAAELEIPLSLPDRNVSQLSSVAGVFTALVPGRVAELKFEDLDAEKQPEQQVGGVAVSLDRVVERQGLWEFHMRLRVESEDAALQSHRGWVFENLTYLVNENGEKVDHAGYETTMATEREVGFVYLFEIPDKVTNYSWIYRTPAAIVTMPVEFELKDVPLP